MTDLRQQTIDTYDKSAKALADYFRGIGSRTDDIEEAFELADNPSHARVIEIGCGDGRDAKEIVKRAGWYLGFDISKELIKLAKEYVPEGEFEVADAATFDFPKNLDLVFAFASLLHLNRDEVKGVLARVHASLKPGGVFYISLKYRPQYMQEVKEDEYGMRLFYFYNADVITELAGNGYEVVKMRREIHGHTEWFEIALRKRKVQDKTLRRGYDIQL